MKDTTKQALEAAAEHVRSAAKWLDCAAASDPFVCRQIESIHGTDRIEPKMADEILRVSRLANLRDLLELSIAAE